MEHSFRTINSRSLTRDTRLVYQFVWAWVYEETKWKSHARCWTKKSKPC